MKKSKARVISLSLVAALSLSSASVLAACGKRKADNESTPLTMASDLFDGVFNPFFYTSGPDGEVVGQTQIGMLSGDADGNPVAGEDEPCVVQEYSIVTTGTSADKGAEGSKDEYANYYTDYYFAIKNDLVFSDGNDLTIEDVLFNIYMYLDPSYVGSSTMYSVNIRGLVPYRTQRADALDEDSFNEEMNNEAQKRIDKISNWALQDQPGNLINGTDEQMTADVNKVEELFMEELNTDWTTAMNADMKEYEKYHFTENWQVFVYNYGLITARPLRNESGDIYDYEIDDSAVPDNVEKTQSALVQYVFDTMIGKSSRQNPDDTYRTNLYNVVNFYATANTFRSYLVAEAMRASLDSDVLNVPNISGIKAEFDQTSIPSADGGTIDLKGTYDVLHITINGEDPKAIQNFSFTVAPMHYYSPIADEFDYEKNNFAVKWSDSEFMDEIRAIQVPLGAGPYRATRSGGSSATETVDKGEFYKNNIVYFERNENFMLGAPKIRYLRYQVISQSLLYESIQSGTIHYGSPTATSTIIGRLEGGDKKTLDYVDTDNLGYGYIGINASKVESLYIRKAIMYALNPQLALDYYGGGQLADIIYRPMSTTLKDYYPKDATAYYPFDESGQTSLAYAQLAGYTPDEDGTLRNSSGETLSFTFTVAGDSTDHPAYQTMLTARNILNEVGFDVEVTTDSTALSKLASGQLEVWAAAWSSSSDPDMYQVYHKDSSATSILNWGFPTIDRSTDSAREHERLLLDELAVRIEEGRETTVVSERRNAYSVSTADPIDYVEKTEYEVNGETLVDVTIAEEGGNPDLTYEETISRLSALDLVMELAVEFPLYQRRALYVFQRDLFNEDTLKLFDESTAFQSPLSKIWLVSFAD